MWKSRYSSKQCFLWTENARVLHDAKEQDTQRDIMSTTEAIQAQSRSHRNGMTAQNIRPRVPSSRRTSKPSADLDREIVPEDSASNAPSVASSRPTLSSRSKVNGVHRSSYEKRTEKTRTTTTTTHRIRTVSPVKSTEGDDTAIPLKIGVPSTEEAPERKKKATRVCHLNSV